MTKLLEINGKQERVFILQTWQLIAFFVVLIFTMGVSYGIGQYKIMELENRQSKIEAWSAEHNKYTEALKDVRDKQYYEIQLNLRLISEKMGIEYREMP